MEIVEEISRDIEQMKAKGLPTEKIVAHVDSMVAEYNLRMLSRIRMQDRVLEAVS